MEREDDMALYVPLLIEWVNAAGNPDARRKLMDPQYGFYPWASGIIASRYRGSLNRSFGWERYDFIQECMLKLLIWAKARPAMLFEPDFDDRRLAAYMRQMAANYANSLNRTRGKRRYDECSGFSAEMEQPNDNTFPAELTLLQNHAILDKHPLRDEAFRCIKSDMQAFARSLYGMQKMLQTYIALLCYCHRLCLYEDVPGHFLVQEILTRSHVHLAAELRSYLQQRFPDDSYSAVNSRLGYLRRSYREFLANRGQDFD